MWQTVDKLLAVIRKSRAKRWTIDLSQFLGGSDHVSSYLLSPFFRDDHIGFNIGKFWITRILLSERLGFFQKKQLFQKKNVHVTVLISSDTTSAGEFTAAFLQRSNPDITIVSVDGVGHTNGRLSSNYSEEVDEIAAPFFPSAYYLPDMDVKRPLESITTVKWKNLHPVAMDDKGRIVARARQPIAPWVVADAIL